MQVFHYFMVKAARIPLLTSISWGAAFLLYYGLLLCCSQLYGLTLALSAALLLPGDATLFGTRRDMFLPQLTSLGFDTRKGIKITIREEISPPAVSPCPTSWVMLAWPRST